MGTATHPLAQARELRPPREASSLTPSAPTSEWTPALLVDPFHLSYNAPKVYELANGLPKAHAFNRARRYMEKKKRIRNIWRAWRDLCPIKPLYAERQGDC